MSSSRRKRNRPAAPGRRHAGPAQSAGAGDTAARLRAALARHRAGDFARVERLCAEILAADPAHPDALHLAAIAAARRGDAEAAVAHARRSLQARPDHAGTLNTLGNALEASGRLEQAEQALRAALARGNAPADAHYNLARVLERRGRQDEALAAVQHAIRARPRHAEAHNQLGKLRYQRGELAEAIAAHRRAIALKPDLAAARNNLAVVLRTAGQHDDAIATLREAVCGRPAYAAAWHNLADTLAGTGALAQAEEAYNNALRVAENPVPVRVAFAHLLAHLGRNDEAEAQAGAAVEAEPACAAAWKLIGAAQRSSGRIPQALRSLEHAATLAPRDPEVCVLLAAAWKEYGRIDRALALHRQALALAPGHPGAYGNLLLDLHYDPGTSRFELYAAHRDWARTCFGSIRSTHMQRRSATPAGPLRIGFLSGQFRSHPTLWLSIRGLEALDPGAVELYGYEVRATTWHDRFTERIRAVCRGWTCLEGLADEQAAERIRADDLDLLIDMAGPAAGRPAILAHRGAPVQGKWVGGLFDTSGMDAMEWLLADAVEVPPGDEDWYSERIYRMPDGYVVYEPPATAPPVGPLPARSAGRVTFGCFNNPAKVNAEIIALWAAILRLVPDSRLRLKGQAFGFPEPAERTRAQFAEHGVDPERLEFEGWSGRDAVLAAYNDIDIALDPWPYSGGLTTCEALWMGVPVLTLPGPSFAGRHAASHLANVGLDEWIAANGDDYVDRAVKWAGRPDALAELRAGLRPRVAASPLCDGDRFARNLEHAFRYMCAHTEIRS